jgi:hypothetical protein
MGGLCLLPFVALDFDRNGVIKGGFSIDRVVLTLECNSQILVQWLLDLHGGFMVS